MASLSRRNAFARVGETDEVVQNPSFGSKRCRPRVALPFQLSLSARFVPPRNRLRSAICCWLSRIENALELAPLGRNPLQLLLCREPQHRRRDSTLVRLRRN